MRRYRIHRSRTWSFLVTGCMIGWLAVNIVYAAPIAGTINKNVNLREGPGTQYRVITGLYAGTPVSITNRENQWVEISATKNHLDYQGWVFARFVEEASGAGPAAPPPEPAPALKKLTPLPAPPADTDTDASETPPSAGIPQPEPEPTVETAIPQPEAAPTVETTVTPPPLTTAAAPLPAQPETSTMGRILPFAAGILSLLAMVVSWQALRFARKYRRLVEDFERMRQKAESRVLTQREKRRHPRVRRLVEVDFASGGRFYRGLIDSISAGGAFIETTATLNVGDTMTVSYPAPNEAGHIKRNGVVTRVDKTGFAVSFTAPAEAECDAP